MVVFFITVNEFVWRETLQGLEPSGEIIGYDKFGEMLPMLIMTAVIEAFGATFWSDR